MWKFWNSFWKSGDKKSRKNTLIIQILKRRFANQWKFSPRKKRRKQNILFLNPFYFKKMKKMKKKTNPLKNIALRKLHTFPKFPRAISQNCQKPKKKFTDSALIIQERDFSHLWVMIYASWLMIIIHSCSSK